MDGPFGWAFCIGLLYGPFVWAFCICQNIVEYSVMCTNSYGYCAVQPLMHLLHDSDMRLLQPRLYVDIRAREKVFELKVKVNIGSAAMPVYIRVQLLHCGVIFPI